MDKNKTSESLPKRLNLLHVYCIAAGALISSGLFVLPGLAHARAGPWVIASYVLAGVLAIMGLLSVAELSTAMPKAGGDYFFISRSFGPAVGTVAGLLSWFSLSLKAAFALVGIGAFAEILLPWPGVIAGLVFAIVFTAVNLRGAHESAGLQVGLVALLFALMAYYVVRGFPAMDVENFRLAKPVAMRDVFATAGFVFVSYGAVVQIASLAGEVRKPGRTIPLGIMLSVVSVILVYALMVMVTTGVLPGEELDNSLTPITDAAGRFMGHGGRIALSLAALLAFLTTANSGIMTGSRYLLALSRDSLAPEWLGRTNRKDSPYVAVLATGALILGALFVRLDVLVEAASVVFLLTYMLASLCVIVLRSSKVENYRPKFRAPFYPYLQVTAIFGLLFVLVEMKEEAYLAGASLVALGLAVYWFHGRKRQDRESALLHLIERITDRKLVTGSLEAELKDIVRERDEIVADRLDKLIEKAAAISVERRMDSKELFEKAAAAFAGRMQVDAGDLAARFQQREEESSTILRDGLAMPHVIVTGEKVFELVLARSCEGFDFPGDSAPVHAALIMAGSADERNFYLRVLAAFAQIAQSKKFEERWLAAKTEQGLRDVLLLGERHRVEKK